jgi:hypothetical protein
MIDGTPPNISVISAKAASADGESWALTADVVKIVPMAKRPTQKVRRVRIFRASPIWISILGGGRRYHTSISYFV